VEREYGRVGAMALSLRSEPINDGSRNEAVNCGGYGDEKVSWVHNRRGWRFPRRVGRVESVNPSEEVIRNSLNHEVEGGCPESSDEPNEYAYRYPLSKVTTVEVS